MRRFIIFGATSGIAAEVARVAAQRGDALFLVGRNAARLRMVADDLRVRGAAAVHERAADLADTSAHDAILDEAERALGGLDTALVAHGVLTDQAEARRDFAVVERDVRVNYLSAASLMEKLAARFEPRRSGVIAVVSSVAGDRGRRTNYAYGASKAALTAFASGLRSRLAPSGVAVVTVKPGFVDTPMIAHLPRSPLFARPATVARDIYRAIERRREVLYTPWFWGPIMTAVRHVPEVVFKRLNF